MNENKWQIIIANNDEELISEVYYLGEQIAEISKNGDQIRIPPRDDGASWEMNLNEFLRIIEQARAKIRIE